MQQTLTESCSVARQVTAVVGISGIDYSGIAGQALWEVHVQVRVPGARHALADAEWLERCTIAGTAGREMAQKWLCSTGRYMDGHPEVQAGDGSLQTFTDSIWSHGQLISLYPSLISF